MRLGSLTMLACACTIAAPPAAGAAAVDDQPAGSPSAAQTATLTPAAIQLLDSGSPIDVLMDPITGDILSVTGAPAASPAIKQRSGCDIGDGCYFTNMPPLADEGFYGGSGEYTGSWPSRSGYSAGSWTVNACWSGGCGVRIGPGSTVDFTSDVTGTSFTIFG